MNKKVIGLLIIVGITLLILIITSSNETPAPEELGNEDYTEQNVSNTDENDEVVEQEEPQEEEAPAQEETPAPPTDSSSDTL